MDIFFVFSKKVWGGYLKKWPIFSIYYERFISVSKSGNKTPLDMPIASAPWKLHTTSRRYHVRATVAGVKGRGQAQSDEDMGKQWYPARLGHTPRGGLPTRMGWVLRCLWSSVTRGLEVDFLTFVFLGRCCLCVLLVHIHTPIRSYIVQAHQGPWVHIPNIISKSLSKSRRFADCPRIRKILTIFLHFRYCFFIV